MSGMDWSFRNEGKTFGLMLVLRTPILKAGGILATDVLNELERS